MSNPRIKRPFAGAASDPSQRQITSFFNARTSFAEQTSEPSRQPVLPSSVQSNLLSVGMRIRKSVPEGYKTVGHSAFKLWTDNTTPAAVRSASTSSKVVGRELLPFCGINKVGGMDTQPAWTSLDDDDDDLDDVPDLDAVPELSLSQESTDSNTSDNARKRFFDDEEPSDVAHAWVETDGWDGEVSPRSLTPWGNGNGGRVMAVPRSRVKKGTPLKKVDQENLSVEQGSDFEEAEFLVYDNEMEMSG
ncbi:hypothetical protein NLU13_3925 [Sarocladium strictum]|uniref:Uncharacterized protein n=1 Tax=Sarocladium strictum TaxID=5046 RepID=A0AA39L8B7_SARSR|nr:hypothetical protein NLU13_3925 [Sarocladium strictum]